MRHKKEMYIHSYLDMYPKTRKWINTCVCCQKSGYDPMMPKVLTACGEVSTCVAQNLRYYYSPMAVDELGRCDECRNAAELTQQRKEV